MYRLHPAKVYMLDSVGENPTSLARMKRILQALGMNADDVAVINRQNIYDISLELLAWPTGRLAPGIPAQHQRPLVFTNVAVDRLQKQGGFLPTRRSDIRNQMVAHILGRMPLLQRNFWSQRVPDPDRVCWKSLDFCVMSGCPHGCHYCTFGKWGTFITVGLNIEEYMAKVVGPTVEKNPWQRSFGIIGPAADVITFEPEYGVFAAFLEKLSHYEGRYGYFHTSSDNVAWITDLRHRERLIGVWSITTDSVARKIEPGAPTATQRLKAARACQDLGVPIRFKFKPVVPIRNWREEYAHVIERTFRLTRPESIGFCVLMWMTFGELKDRINLELLDPAYVIEAERSTDDLKKKLTGPFPHQVRAEIYRFLIGEVRRWDTKVPIFLSTESRAIWDEMAPELGQDPRTFVCGCNPVQLPGPRMFASSKLPFSTYIRAGRKSR
jgi:hypothetical protein